MGSIPAQGTKTLLSYEKTQSKKEKETKKQKTRKIKPNTHTHTHTHTQIFKFDIRDFWEAVLGWRLSHIILSHIVHGYSLTKQKSDFHGYFLG